jgi:hypothetical protein
MAMAVPISSFPLSTLTLHTFPPSSVTALPATLLLRRESDFILLTDLMMTEAVETWVDVPSLSATLADTGKFALTGDLCLLCVKV